MTIAEILSNHCKLQQETAMCFLKPLQVAAQDCNMLHFSCNLQWIPLFVGSMEAPSKTSLLFFLLPDWLKLNNLKSRMECGFSDIFSRYICSNVAKTIGVTNYAASFGAKKCSENHI